MNVADAKKKAVAAWRRRDRGPGKLSPLEVVFLESSCRIFAKGFDAAVKALAK